MSNDTLIASLSANLTPVKRRSALRETALLLAVGGVELMLFLRLGLMRHDMGHVIGSGYMMWKLGGLALLAVVSCAVMIRSLAPTASPRRGLAIMLALAAAMTIAGMMIDPGPGQSGSLLDRISPAHGLLCSLSIIILSLPMVAVMGMLMRRGAPSHPEGSALVAGLAASASGALIFAFCCPVNDPLYVVTWYSVGCAIVAMSARWLLPRGFRL